MIRHSLAATLTIVCVFGLRPAAGDQPISLTVLVKVLDEVEVPAREAGLLTAIEVREGAHVQQDDVLAQIDDAEAQHLLEQARLEAEIAAKNAANDLSVQMANKAQGVAEALLERAVEAEKRFPGSISQTELDRLRLDDEKAALAILQAEHELEVAGLTRKLKLAEFEFAGEAVARRRIVAPFSGVVVDVSRRRGEWVQPGDPVLRVIRLDRLRAEGFLDSEAAVPGVEGRSVRLTAESPRLKQSPFSGQVVFVSPEVDPVNGQVRVLMDIDNPDLLLRPGLRATAAIGPETQ